MSSIYIYSPELNYHFPNYWKINAEIEFKDVNIPEFESDSSSLLPANSFIEMLFNNNYNADSTEGTYNYLFKEVKIWDLDKSTERRLKSTSKLTKSYVIDSSTGDIDLYSLSDSTSDNRRMLDQLLEYRMGNSVDLSGIDYEDLTTDFSKLVYQYLDLMSNGIYDKLDTISVLSDSSSTINNMFELYLLNESHKILRVKKELLLSDSIELRPVRKKYIIDDATSFNPLIIIDPLPYNIYTTSVIKNGDLLDEDVMVKEFDSTSVTIYFNTDSSDYGVTFKEGDIVIVDYYTQIDIS